LKVPVTRDAYQLRSRVPNGPGTSDAKLMLLLLERGFQGALIQIYEEAWYAKFLQKVVIGLASSEKLH